MVREIGLPRTILSGLSHDRLRFFCPKLGRSGRQSSRSEVRARGPVGCGLRRTRIGEGRPASPNLGWWRPPLVDEPSDAQECNGNDCQLREDEIESPCSAPPRMAPIPRTTRVVDSKTSDGRAETTSHCARYARGAHAAQDIKIGLVRLGCRLNRQAKLTRAP
jgi:hypothetical protein